MSGKLALKRFLGMAAGLVPRPSARRLILLYHSVGTTQWATPAPQFRKQLEWLAEFATVTTVQEIVEGPGQAPLEVALTFDDGYASLYRQALPAMRDIGARATVFLNTGWIGDSQRRRSDAALGHYPGEEFLLWREVEELVAAGWTAGSHGVDHLDLTQVEDREAHAQLAHSKNSIESALAVPCRQFAYTWGRHTSHLRRLVKEAGYEFAMSAEHAAVSARSDPFAIPRINIARDYEFRDFIAIVKGDWDYLRWSALLRMRRA